MNDEQPDDLFGDDAEGSAAFDQGGPDLFGLEPSEVIVTHEPEQVVDLGLDLDADEFSEIPIDPDDAPETQLTAADVPDAVPEASEPEAPEPEAPAPEAPGPEGSAVDSSGDAGAAESAAPAPTPPSPPARAAGTLAPSAPWVAASGRPEAPLALYRRYRPDTFAEVIGQDHVTEPLRRALINNRVNHAYLFSGPRGCGKTTSARILARCLNCEEGPTPEPCGVCQSCRDLARGGSGSIDVIEIDAASHGGVNEARDLRERAFFAPVHSRYKIYIIDEAHMVTKEGFNALLKLVEEPPPHVKFIFATTEPEKVLGTIRSRTHHYPFRLVPPKVLGAYLEQLCVAEGVRVDKSVLPLVVRAGAGSVRDSLSVLDQLLGGAGEKGVSYRQATALLGYTPDTLLDEIMDAFAAGDAEGVFACIDKVIEVGQDPRRFAEDLLRRLRDLIIVAAVPEALTSGLVDFSHDQGERLTVQAQGLGAGELTRAAEVIAKGLTDMRGTTAPRLHLELMCARVLLPGADVDERGIHARLDRLERRLHMVGGEVPQAQPPAAASGGRPRPAPAAEQNAPQGGGGGWAADWDNTAPPEGHAGYSRGQGFGPPGPPEPEARAARPDGRGPGDRGPTTQAGKAGAESRKEHGGPARAPAGTRPIALVPPAAPSAPSGVDPESLTTADVRRMWPQVLDAVKARRRVTWIVLSQNAQVHALEGGVLTLALSSAGARESFGRGGSPDILRESLIEVLGLAPTIETVVAGGPPLPPAGAAAPRQAHERGAAPRQGAAPEASAPTGRAEPGRPESGRPEAPGPEGAGQAPGRPVARRPEPGRRGAAGGQPGGEGGFGGAGEAPSGSRGDSGDGAPSYAGADAPGPRTGAAVPRPDVDANAPRAGGRRPAPSVASPEPPPDEEDVDYERPTFAALARENLRRGPVAAPPPAEQTRDDADLDGDEIELDELLTQELGAQLIADETDPR